MILMSRQAAAIPPALEEIGLRIFVPTGHPRKAAITESLLSACCMPDSRGPLDTQLAELQLPGPSTSCHSCSSFKGG